VLTVEFDQFGGVPCLRDGHDSLLVARFPARSGL
jgi:hypothetical protein